MDFSDALKNTESERREFAWRVAIAAAGILILVGILVGRMLQLQVSQHDDLVTRANDNRMSLEVVAGVRGLIHDRKGTVLAENIPAYRLEITPEQVDDLERTIAALSRIIQIGEHDRERFDDRVARTAAFRAVPLRLRLDPAEVARFEVSRESFPGVRVVAGLTRSYPLGATAAHIIGYVGGITAADLERIEGRSDYRGATHIGKTGIERHYENLLHGAPGSKLVEVNAVGRRLRELEYSPGTPGHDLVLALDARLQGIAEDAFGDRRGAAALIDIHSGDLLALAALPAFDPNLFVDGISHRDYNKLTGDDGRPLFNRAVQGRYPPGSTVKPLVALAGLEYGITDAQRRIDCPGFYQLPDRERRHRDWKRKGHGHMNLHDAIAQSCDVWFYDLAYRMGIDPIHEFLSRFGLGQATGVDLPGEGKGLLPSQQWKRTMRGEAWFPGETLNIGIGQGFMVLTPLQLVQFTALIAGQGQAYRPRLLREMRTGASGTADKRAPEPLPRVTLRDSRNWDRIHQAMVAVMHGPRGTARLAARGAEYRIAGKTGTAQVAGLSQEDDTAPQLEDVPEKLRDHSLFIAYAPADAPRYAVAVIVEHSGSGSAVAAPIARRLLDAALEEAR